MNEARVVSYRTRPWPGIALPVRTCGAGVPPAVARASRPRNNSRARRPQHSVQDACTSAGKRNASLGTTGMLRAGKDVKIVETNSTSLLESIKPQKNELKTNPKRTPKNAEIRAVMTLDGLNKCYSTGASLPPPVLVGLKRIGEFEKDVKIVETNSISPLESIKLSKTSSKRTQMGAKKRAGKTQIRSNTALGTDIWSFAFVFQGPSHGKKLFWAGSPLKQMSLAYR